MHQASAGGKNPANPATVTLFAITKTQIYFPEVKRSAKDNARLLLQLAVTL